MNSPSFHLLTGRINPKDHLQQYKDTSHFLEAKTLENFFKLQVAAKNEINAQLEIISSYRDFSRQESIWNRKVSGELKILDDNERVINPKNYSQKELITKIARFSAIPGASRHHWGTDIDIYDASQIKKEEVKLIHSECVDNGPCAKLHEWLDQKINNDESFGFYRPYAKDLDGVAVERWHLSYAETAQNYFSNYTLELFIENLKQSNTLLKQPLIKNAQSYFNKFVTNISFP